MQTRQINITNRLWGANVIDKINSNHKYGSDLNPYLIALLKHVQSGGALYKEVSRELYNKAKTAFITGNTSEFEDWQIGNIGFLASYNGKWFDGGYAKPGYEKTKYGVRYRDYYRESRDNLIKQAPNLNGINFTVCDYKDRHPYGFVIYADPPYASTTQYKNAINFDYNEFWDKMREWSKNNIVLVSEQNAPSDWSSIWEKDINRSLNARNKNTATEQLFIYKN